MLDHTAAAIATLGLSALLAATPAHAAVGGPGPAVTASVPGTLNSVTCTNPTSCIAVGTYGTSGDTLAENWNGTAWTVESTPNPAGGSSNTLAGVSCGTPDACVA